MKHRPPKNIIQKKEKDTANRKFWEVFLFEGGFFFITSLLSVICAFRLNELIKLKEVYLPKMPAQNFLLFFLLLLVYFLIFISYKKGEKFKGIIYRGILIMMGFWGAMTILGLFLPVFMAIILAGILIWFWIKSSSIWVHDLLMVLGIAGVASFFGLGFSPSVVVAILLIFSIYDFIAAYKTKHGVLMAEEMAEKGVIIGIVIPKEAKYFKSNISQIKQRSNFIILGAEDVIFPCLLAISVVPISLIGSIIIVLFSLIGLFFNYYLLLFQETNKGGLQSIPTLPAISLCAIVGYLIALFF